MNELFLGIVGAFFVLLAYLIGKANGAKDVPEQKPVLEQPTEEQVRQAKKSAKQLENFYAYDGYTVQSDDV